VMAAVCDDQGRVVPGFESDKCLLQNSDRLLRPSAQPHDSRLCDL
jgi:hypothetical protein